MKRYSNRAAFKQWQVRCKKSRTGGGRGLSEILRHEQTFCCKPMDLAYLPLVQAISGSFIGAIGAFAVAAYSVHKSNRFSANREATQAERTAHKERGQHIRLKLEELLQVVGELIRVPDQSRDRIVELMHLHGADSRAFKQEDMALVVRGADLADKALVIAQLYFPTLEPVVRSMEALFFKTQSFNAACLSALVDDFEEAKKRLDFPYVQQYFQEKAPLMAAHAAVLAEAKKLIESSFAPAQSSPSA